MSIYKKGCYDLYMYQGDTGNIMIKGLPETYDFDMYFQVSKQSGEILISKMVSSKEQSSVVISISADESDRLEVGTYNWGVKLCYDRDGHMTEETLIPPLANTSATPTSFRSKAILSIYPKQVEGAINGEITE